MKCAPVLIITLHRFDKLRACIESLQRNYLAGETDLYVALDCPRDVTHVDGQLKIKNYLNELQGFQSVKIINRPTNFGIIRNYLDAMDSILTNNDRVIFSEDDNVFSVDFLSFMNTALSTYEHEKTVFTISGYGYPLDLTAVHGSPVYRWCGHSAWGFGIWRDRWLQLSWDVEKVFASVSVFLKDYAKVHRLERVANHYLPALLTVSCDGRLNGDTVINLHQFLNGYQSVFPVVTRVRNGGQDGSGRSGSIDISGLYDRQTLYCGPRTESVPLETGESPAVSRRLSQHFRRPRHHRIKSYIKLALHNMGVLSGDRGR
jgi:hypothetical protein